MRSLARPPAVALAIGSAVKVALIRRDSAPLEVTARLVGHDTSKLYFEWDDPDTGRVCQATFYTTGRQVPGRDGLAGPHGQLPGAGVRRDALAASLFGRARPALTLREPVAVLRAVLRSECEIRCGDLFVSSPNPIAALCSALVAAALAAGSEIPPETGLLVAWVDGTPAAYVMSVAASAWDARRLQT